MNPQTNHSGTFIMLSKNSPSYSYVADDNRTDNVGNVVMNVAYDPFGNIVSGALEGEYGFSTKPLVQGIDWYYYGFRYYDPMMGRWPSRDPIGERGFHILRMQLSSATDFLFEAKVAELTAYLINEFNISLPRSRSAPRFVREFESLYGFVSNNGINEYDYLGLTGCTGLDPDCKDGCDQTAATCLQTANDNYTDNLAFCLLAINPIGIATCVAAVTNSWADALTACNDIRNDCLAACPCICSTQ